MWIWYLSRSDRGDVATIAATAHLAGVRTLIIKSGDGSSYWSQFSRQLVRTLQARGLHVCAWQYVYGTNPISEANVGVRAARAGAECLVIDAETEYEGRYASAQSYVRHLRSALGRGYLLGLASFPYVDYHPGFPYSVFLGPGGAQFDLPQMYWKDINASVDATFHHTYTYNRVYKRTILPVGQLYGAPLGSEIDRFRSLSLRYRAPGLSWWDYAWSTASGFWSTISLGLAGASAITPLGDPLLGPGAKGDDVLWLQEHLARAIRSQRTTGLFGAQTESNLRAFQARRGLLATGRTDPATWRALLHLAPVPVSWLATTASVARASAQAGHAAAPASASLGALANEIPELGAQRVPVASTRAEP
jgi:hypothetical protein